VHDFEHAFRSCRALLASLLCRFAKSALSYQCEVLCDGLSNSCVRRWGGELPVPLQVITLESVANRQQLIDDLIGRSRDWTPIAVGIGSEHPLASHLLELAKARRWQLVGLEEYQGQLPTNLAVRGALVSRLPTSPLVVDLLRRGIPTVRLGWMPHEEDHLVPAVIVDRSADGRAAAEHFHQRGFRHIAFIAHPSWAFNRPLYRGLLHRARELGCSVHLQRMHGERPQFARDSPEQWRYQQEDFTRSLRRFPLPVGLLASSDVTASRYCRWILDAGLRVPEDVAVLGVGNHRFLCDSSPVPISSVSHDWIRILNTAVAMLIQLMEGKPVDPPCVQVPPRGVVTRQSTDVLAATDPRVVNALRFMWDHIHEDLSVDQIARHVGVTRRTLERAFSRDLSRGVREEFQRRRLDKARELIIQTDLPIARIAEALSFRSVTYLGRVFRETYHQSPAQYRADRARQSD
jgi:LacI family transcriptional regulator